MYWGDAGVVNINCEGFSMHIHAHMHKQSSRNTYIAFIHPRTYTYIRIHKCVHTHIKTYMHAYIYTQEYIHTNTHKNTYIYTHTYIYRMCARHLTIKRCGRLRIIQRWWRSHTKSISHIMPWTPFVTVCMYACMCMYIYACIYLFACVCLTCSNCVAASVCAHVCIHTNTHTHTHA